MKQKKERKPLPIAVYIVIYLAVIAACIAIDQISKHYVEIAVANSSEHKIRILGDWLTLVWTTNTGATGSMFSNLAWRNWLFFAMTVIGIPIFGWLLWRSRTRSVWGQVAYSFIIGGTIGNAIDRIRFAEDGFFTGSVRDFIRVEGFFGIFNGADSFLVVGVILALLAIVFFDPDSLLMGILKDRNSKKEQAAESSVTTDKESIATSEDVATSEEQPSIEEQSLEQHPNKSESTDENDTTDV